MARLEALRLSRRPAGGPRGWRSLGWLALGLAVAATTLLAALPAAWIADAVAGQTRNRLLLADAQGTLWQGSATLALSAGSGSETATVLPGRLQWSLAFWPLFAGRLRVTLNHTEAMSGPVGLTVTPAGWQAQAGALRLPAALLEGLGAPFNSLRPDGRMQLDWTALSGRFSARDSQVAGHLTVRLDNMSSAVSRLRPLGSYRAEIDWSGGAGRLQLRTVKGPLHLEGEGALGRQARFEGTAHADPDAANQLVGLLSLLGRREDNVTRLQF